MQAWVAFSAVTGYTLHLASQKRMAPTTPQRVYTFFLAVYKSSVIVGFAGYFLLVLELFGIGMLLRPVLSPMLSIQMLCKPLLICSLMTWLMRYVLVC
jgi:RING finger protein 121